MPGTKPLGLCDVSLSPKSRRSRSKSRSPSPARKRSKSPPKKTDKIKDILENRGIVLNSINHAISFYKTMQEKEDEVYKSTHDEFSKKVLDSSDGMLKEAESQRSLHNSNKTGKNTMEVLLNKADREEMLNEVTPLSDETPNNAASPRNKLAIR